MAAGLLVSFTATAGHDSQGFSTAALGTAAFGTAALVSGPLVPPVGLDDAPAGGAPGAGAQARLRFDLPVQREVEIPDQPPREHLKRRAGPFPIVDRRQKGDPLVMLRPSFSRRGREVREMLQASGHRLTIGLGDEVLPPTVLLAGPLDAVDLESDPGFVPWRPEELTTTRQAAAASSPMAAASGTTAVMVQLRRSTSDGTTPVVTRAVVLSSTTPAPADATPIQVAAVPVSYGGIGLSRHAGGLSSPGTAQPGERPNYADLVTPDTIDREQRCLAEAVYFEARSEPEEGQAAVAQVVLNRAKSGLYPSSICGVVYQNRHRYLGCQFTFACEGKALHITDSESWQNATRIAQEVLEGKTYLTQVGASTHYHADYVHPRWARRLTRMEMIGRHIFYRLKPGQT